jgi:hypothetical protein
MYSNPPVPIKGKRHEIEQSYLVRQRITHSFYTIIRNNYMLGSLNTSIRESSGDRQCLITVHTEPFILRNFKRVTLQPVAVKV